MWLVAGALLPSFLVAWAAGFAIRRWAPQWGLVDRPDTRKVHQRATPLGGGVAIWLGVALPLAAGHLVLAADRFWQGSVPLPEIIRRHSGGLWQQASRLWVLLAAATVLMLLGLWDDRRGLGWKPRLTVELLVATFIVWFWRGWRLTLFVDIPWLTAAASVAWIVALINSFNMLDNMDALSGGVAAIAALLLAVVLLASPFGVGVQPQLFVGGLLLVLAGAVLGFLWHNRPPARLFMGDAGSYFVGFALATTTMMATFAGGNLPRHAVLAPLCVLAIPLYDMATVVAIRLRRGTSPFEGDRNHFSHRLVELGMTKGQAVLTIYLATATCGLGALLLPQVNGLGAWIILLQVGCVLMLVGLLEALGRTRRRD